MRKPNKCLSPFVNAPTAIHPIYDHASEANFYVSHFIYTTALQHLMQRIRTDNTRSINRITRDSDSSKNFISSRTMERKIKTSVYRSEIYSGAKKKTI